MTGAVPTGQSVQMTAAWWWIPAGLVVALAGVWLALALMLVFARPRHLDVGAVLRLLPDLLRMLKRLASDRDLPWPLRAALVGLLVYMASPIDLIPDALPVIGVADDVILIAVVLRWVTRRAGAAVLADHWPGTSDGLRALQRLFGVGG